MRANHIGEGIGIEPVLKDQWMGRKEASMSPQRTRTPDKDRSTSSIALAGQLGFISVAHPCARFASTPFPTSLEAAPFHISIHFPSFPVYITVECVCYTNAASYMHYSYTVLLS